MSCFSLYAKIGDDIEIHADYTNDETRKLQMISKTKAFQRVSVYNDSSIRKGDVSCERKDFSV